MNISSILITIVGIIVILALYVMSRSGQRNLTKNTESKLPTIKDKDGELFTSILDDIPATDGGIISTQKPASSINNINRTNSSDDSNKTQIILFVSGSEEKPLDGNLIQETLLKNELVLGDKNIYHYFVNKEDQPFSLFRVANGIEPWTLTDKDLKNNQLVGISLVMLLPNLMPKKQSIGIFLDMADSISTQVNGVLKNQQQEAFSETDRETLLNL